MKKKILICYSIIILFCISFVSAEIPIIKLGVPNITSLLENQSVLNVNSSDFWDDLDTPADITNSEYWYNHTLDVWNLWGEWFYNQTQAVYDIWNDIWISTYNSTYDSYAKNVSINYTLETYNTYDGRWYNIGGGDNESWNETRGEDLFDRMINENFTDGDISFGGSIYIPRELEVDGYAYFDSRVYFDAFTFFYANLTSTASIIANYFYGNLIGAWDNFTEELNYNRSFNVYFGQNITVADSIFVPRVRNLNESYIELQESTGDIIIWL